MTKVVSHAEQGNMPLNGKWEWNEISNQLEYTSNIPGGERLDKKGKSKLGQQKQGIHGNPDRKKDHRGATPSSKAYGRGRQSRIPGQRSPTKQNEKETHVTLAYIKDVTLRCLETDEYVDDFESTIYQTDQFDEFLRYLLNYFHWFYEKRAQDTKPNPMNIEPSRAELQHYEELCKQLEAAQKQLGRAYCVLVLGIGLQPLHHMECGHSRVSSTYKDRRMYEKLYSFLAFLVWIAFRRKDYNICRKEIGRILRSDTFNPAIRVKMAPSPEPTDEEGKGEKSEESKAKKLTPAEYRRLHGKRPPIKSIINQRSPALVSIMPAPKEEATWLFRRKGALSPTSLSTIGRENLQDEDVDSSYQHLYMRKSELKVGIIGEPLSQFNPITLTPIGAETEDGEENDEEDDGKPKNNRRESAVLSMGHEPGMSRQQTGISMATTEGHLSDGD